MKLEHATTILAIQEYSNSQEETLIFSSIREFTVTLQPEAELMPATLTLAHNNVDNFFFVFLSDLNRLFEITEFDYHQINIEIFKGNVPFHLPLVKTKELYANNSL